MPGAPLDARCSVAPQAKNRSSRSIELIWSLWRRRPETIAVPGHDLPLVLRNGEPIYLGKRSAAITAWLGNDLEQTTRFELSA